VKVLVVGLGGAGCRIVDALQAQENRYSRMGCLVTLAIDSDAACLRGLSHVPVARRHLLAHLEPHEGTIPLSQTLVEEIIAKVHQANSVDNDAILICGGLGGSSLDAIPILVPPMRSEVYEPIFGLFTLPSVTEGKGRAAQAADQIDCAIPLLDGCLCFDNEAWKERLIGKARVKRGLIQQIPYLGGPRHPNMQQHLYALINDAIAKRIALLLRAGEYNGKEEDDNAETFLDAGEILNTIYGMGIITIGYAVERAHKKGMIDAISPVRIRGARIEDAHRRATRVVDLGRYAVNEDMSTPCDIATAKKALVLVAGPANALSMKGYLSVRKWVDRSISGNEVRAGDYPVPSSQFVALIIILAGVEGVPRIEQMRRIRDEMNRPARVSSPPQVAELDERRVPDAAAGGTPRAKSLLTKTKSDEKSTEELLKAFRSSSEKQ
jgi:cell division GTPase FtsZ